MSREVKKKKTNYKLTRTKAGEETTDRQHELKFGRRNGGGRARREMPIHVQESRKEVPEGVELKEKHGSHSV